MIEVELRWWTGSDATRVRFPFPDDDYYLKVVRPWTKTVHSRNRWFEDRDAIRRREAKALSDLAAWGVSAEKLREMSEAQHIEVGLEYVSDEQGYAARTLPWEFILNAATWRARERDDRSVVVTRHLITDRPSNDESNQNPTNKILFVQSSPGKLSGVYSFTSEHGQMKSVAEGLDGSPSFDFHYIVDPTLNTLSDSINSISPAIIHFTGIDNKEGYTRLNNGSDATSVMDGFYLARGDGTAQQVHYRDFAKSIDPVSDTPPKLVTFNCFYSAARIAPTFLARGASCAVGIQDTIDDHLAEAFYVDFIKAYIGKPGQIFDSFRDCLEGIRRLGGRMFGTGVVLWTNKSLLPQTSDAEIQDSFSSWQQQVDEIEIESEEAARRSIDVTVKVHRDLNYAMLHNGRSLFERFRLSTNSYGRVRDIYVNVELRVGREVFPFHASYDVTLSKEISHFIRVPLTWETARAVSETVRTTLFVEVKQGEKVIYQQTHSVNLHPLNQWRDNRRDGNWLPSFVLPRDPAIENIIEASRRNLMVLSGDYFACFDGYQRGDPEQVDLQVEAIWSTLAFMHDIQYVEPPPAYSEHAQRLRTPSEVLGAKLGTCIDLSLLVAACIEYIGIHPVIFLTKGHASVGYWRDWRAHRDFMIDDTMTEEFAPQPEIAAPFEFRSHAYHQQVSQFIEIGALGALEATLITEHAGFDEALKEGLESIKYQYEFDAMFDIDKARFAEITPLPLHGEYYG